jgi:hypothetical protein
MRYFRRNLLNISKNVSNEAYTFFFDATAPIWALAYLHETLRFTSVFWILDRR